jgi:hypothetical protein
VFVTPRVSRRARLLAAAGALLLAGVGTAGILLNLSGGQTASTVVNSHGVQSTPSVPVAVLNASRTRGAAGKLAGQLRGNGVKIGKVGNLRQSRPPGLLILYAPGYKSDAAALARGLASRRPAVQPIDPAVQAAAGSKARLALVIS